MQISAVGIVIQFWDTEGRLPRPAWMSMFIVFSEQAHPQRSFKGLLSSTSLVCQSPVSHPREAVNWNLDFRTQRYSRIRRIRVLALVNQSGHTDWYV